MSRKVSDLIAEFLEEKGITHVFGIVGAGNVHLFDSITERGYTRIVCTHHEQAAVMAASTFYRTRGVLAAAIVTTGAGSSNAVTGVVSAHMDSIPVLVISGNENSKFTQPDNHLRIWGVQGYDSSKMMETATKYADRVTCPESVLEILGKGVETCLAPRTGPVWIDIPMNIQASRVDADKIRYYKPEESAVAHPTQNLNANIDRILRLMSDAQRPLLWLGHGIRLSGGVSLIEPLIEKLKSPALVSWAGIDMIDSDHPYVVGRAGVYGQRAANFALQNSDFILAIGTRLALPQVGYNPEEFAPLAKLACVDVDALELEKHSDRIEVPVLADAKSFIESVLALPTMDLPDYSPWVQTCQDYRKEFPWVGPEHQDKDGYINSYPFMEKLVPHLKDDQHIVTDMGTALLSGHQVLSLKPGQRLMTSTGLGEMGFGLPAAIGVAFGREKDNVRGDGQGEVLCLNCDGGMMMNLQELQTVVQYRLPIKIIIFNNDGYLMIKHTQNALFKGRWAGVNQETGVSCPDYTKLAHAFDIPAFQIRSWEDFDSVIPQVQQADGPVICEVFTHPEQLLVPKLALATKKDGTYVSPPLEDLTPFLPRDVLKRHLIKGLHPKSKEIGL